MKVSKEYPKNSPDRPAFPHDFPEYNEVESGMTKRFYAACAAIQGMLANPYYQYVSLDTTNMVNIAYRMADELIKQE